MKRRVRGQSKLLHLFDPRTIAIIVSCFKGGIGIEDLAHLMQVEPALIEEQIRLVMNGVVKR